MEAEMNKQESLLSSSPLSAMFTDYYQYNMAYAYWKTKKHLDWAVFEVYFRKNPFECEYTIFTGLTEVLEHISSFRIKPEDVEFLKKALPPHVEEEFFEYLSGVNLSSIKLTACKEGTVVFPHIPLIIIEGPILVVQLLETSVLNFVNFSSLVTTNASHFRNLVGDKCQLAEYGARRAQGPNGSMTATVKSYIGGFDSTSNVLAGYLYGIPLSGTISHSFVSSCADYYTESTFEFMLTSFTGKKIDLFDLSIKKLGMLRNSGFLREMSPSMSELMSFLRYAIAHPRAFLVVIDTYNVIRSGLPNFCAVALALNDCGFKPRGIRIDSGDLAFFSRFSRSIFRKVAEHFNVAHFSKLLISASNDISTEVLALLNQQEHEIDAFGIGNQLVTCQAQTSLGLVFKLVQINDQPTIKITAQTEKTTIPYKKKVYRLYNSRDIATLDLIMHADEEEPKAGSRILCRHPFNDLCRVYLTPSKVDELHQVYFENGKILQKSPGIHELKKIVQENISKFSRHVVRYLKPIPYKVSLSCNLYEKFHALLRSVTPIVEIS